MQIETPMSSGCKEKNVCLRPTYLRANYPCTLADFPIKSLKYPYRASIWEKTKTKFNTKNPRCSNIDTTYVPKLT